MSNDRSEVILFLPINQMYRFTTKALEENLRTRYAPLARFVDEFFDESHPMRQPDKNFNQIDYIGYIRNALSFSSKYYVASFNIERSTNNYYGLFYIAKNIKGLEKAVETKWELDTNCGEGHEIQKGNLFAEEYNEDKKEDCLKQFTCELTDYLRSEKTNTEIYEFTLSNGFLPKHTSQILKKLANENLLYFDVGKPRGYYLDYNHHKRKNIKYRVKIK